MSGGLGARLRVHCHLWGQAQGCPSCCVHLILIIQGLEEGPRARGAPECQCLRPRGVSSGEESLLLALTPPSASGPELRMAHT